MATSLETRVPLLDHRVVELAFSLPFSYKFREGQTKWPLRKILYKHVPRSLVDRPKRGFSVPIADWLRGPLRERAMTCYRLPLSPRMGCSLRIPSYGFGSSTGQVLTIGRTACGSF